MRPHVTKSDTNMRESITANERLTITLRYLDTGRTFTDLQFSAVMGKSITSSIILETCEAIAAALENCIKVIITNTFVEHTVIHIEYLTNRYTWHPLLGSRHRYC